MIEYKELHFHRAIERDFVEENEISKFINDPRFFDYPYKEYLMYSNIITGYYFNSPFYFKGNYTTWLSVFKNEGWKLLNVYWKTDHKVMVFVKGE